MNLQEEVFVLREYNEIREKNTKIADEKIIRKIAHNIAFKRTYGRYSLADLPPIEHEIMEVLTK
jgi:hypothetical protein